MCTILPTLLVYLWWLTMSYSCARVYYYVMCLWQTSNFNLTEDASRIRGQPESVRACAQFQLIANCIRGARLHRMCVCVCADCLKNKLLCAQSVYVCVCVN